MLIISAQPLSFETIGTDIEVVIPSKTGTEEIHAGMSVSEGLGEVSLKQSSQLDSALTRPRTVQDHQGSHLLPKICFKKHFEKGDTRET